jgi:hypothetical protein
MGSVLKQGREPWDGRNQTVVLQVAVSFLQACAEGVSRIC